MKADMFAAVVLNGQYLVSFKVDIENAFPLLTLSQRLYVQLLSIQLHLFFCASHRLL